MRFQQLNEFREIIIPRFLQFSYSSSQPVEVKQWQQKMFSRPNSCILFASNLWLKYKNEKHYSHLLFAKVTVFQWKSLLLNLKPSLLLKCLTKSALSLFTACIKEGTSGEWMSQKLTFLWWIDVKDLITPKRKNSLDSVWLMGAIFFSVFTETMGMFIKATKWQYSFFHELFRRYF